VARWQAYLEGRVVAKMMSDVELYRLAGWSTVLSAIALVISGIALAIFFAGPGEPFGSINDAFIAISLIALIPAVLAVDRLSDGHLAPFVRIVTIAAIAGIVLASVGQILLIVRVITLEDSYVTGGLGILPVLAWFVLVPILALGAHVLPATVGALAVASLVSIVILSVVSIITLGPALWVSAVVLVAVVSAWLGSLALAFTAASPQVAFS
jgi:hypothetical protein